MNDQNYSSSDIHIAATLLATGNQMSIPPTRSQQQYGSRAKAVFHFADTKELREVILGYTNGSIKVNPRELFARLRELKSLVHNLL